MQNSVLMITQGSQARYDPTSNFQNFLFAFDVDYEEVVLFPLIADIT